MTTLLAKASSFLRSHRLQQQLLGLRLTTRASTLASEGSVQAYLDRRSLKRFMSYAVDFPPQPWNLKLLKDSNPCPVGQTLR